MKYCTKCGNQIADESTFCPVCGAQVAAPQAAPQVAPQQPEQPYAQPQQYYAPQQPAYYAPVKQESGLTTAAKILMIVGTVFMGFYLIPLAWCIPMTVIYFRKLKNNEPISTGFKVCCLLFVSLIGGILMLCDKEH